MRKHLVKSDNSSSFNEAWNEFAFHWFLNSHLICKFDIHTKTSKYMFNSHFNIAYFDYVLIFFVNFWVVSHCVDQGVHIKLLHYECLTSKTSEFELMTSTLKSHFQISKLWLQNLKFTLYFFEVLWMFEVLKSQDQIKKWKKL